MRQVVDALRERLPSGTRWSGHFVTSVLLVAVAAFAAVDGLVGVSTSLFTPGLTSADDPLAPLLDESREYRELCVRRTEGRSLFTPPTPPPRPAPPTPPTPPAPPAPPPPPPAPTIPTTYTGPRPTGLMPTGVVFEGKSPLRVGESSGGVKVLAILDAKRVKLAHAGGEYEVDVFAVPSLADLSQPWRSVAMPESGATGVRLHVEAPPVPPVTESDPEAQPAEGTPKETAPGVDPAEAAEEAARSGEAQPDPNAAEEVPGTVGTVPEALSAEAVQAMTREEATQALIRIRDAKKDPELVPADRSRMDREQTLLIERLRALQQPAGQPPAAGRP